MLTVTPTTTSDSLFGPQPAPPLGIRAYARRRGTSAPSVLRAIKRQRLKDSLVWANGKAKIADPELADREWAANTDLSRAPGYVKEQAEAPVVQPDGVTAVTASVTPPVTPEAARNTVQPGSLAEASTREKNAKASLAELEYLEKAGELVPAKAVEAAWLEMVAQMRASVLGVPSKAKALCQSMTHADLAQLSELLVQALEGLAERSAVERSTGGVAA